MLSVGLDIGGTNIDAGLYDETGNRLESASVTTGAFLGRAHVCRQIALCYSELLGRAGISADEIGSVGMGYPGAVDREKRTFGRATNLHCMEGVAAPELLKDFPKERIAVENDANAAAIGEYLFGAGRDAESLLLVTLGTGIGAGFLEKGRLYTGFDGRALEAGHTVIRVGGRLCGCGRRGCFERYGSAGALVLNAVEEMGAVPESLLWELCGGTPERLSAKAVFDARALGDLAASRALERYLPDLATGILNLILLFKPEVLAIGGGLSAQKEEILAPIRHIYENGHRPENGKDTRIEIAKRRDCGALGAAMLYRQSGDQR